MPLFDRRVHRPRRSTTDRFTRASTRAHAGARPWRAWCAALVLTIPLAGCGVAEAEHRKVVAERDSLRTALAAATAELDELKHGAPRLLGLAQAALDSGQFEIARQHSTRLLERHPQASEAPQARAIIAAADRGIAAREAEEQRKREEAERAKKARLARALAGLYSKRDEMRGLRFYYANGTPRYISSASAVVLYIVKPDQGYPWLRLSIRYVAGDWLFIERYLIKADDQTFTIEVNKYGDVERDNGGGDIWEWYDTSADVRELEIIRAIIASKRAVIRYEGRQYYKDRTITDAEKRRLQVVLDAYEAMQQQL